MTDGGVRRRRRHMLQSGERIDPRVERRLRNTQVDTLVTDSRVWESVSGKAMIARYEVLQRMWRGRGPPMD
jgi:hypothetical protein